MCQVNSKNKNNQILEQLVQSKYHKLIDIILNKDFLEKCFDKINRKKLINILKLKIDDQRFFEVINNFFNSKILDVTFKTGNIIEGVPQGNVLLLILSNIYLNEFNRFVESLMLEFYKGKERKFNLIYSKIKSLQRSSEEPNSI